MKQGNLTYDQYHILFQSYLTGKFEDAKDEVAAIMETAEDIVPYTLNQYFGTTYSIIYDIQEIGEIETLRKKIKAHNVLKVVDMKADPRYTEVLKWYGRFLKSLSKNQSPLLVPGEEESSMVASPGPEDSYLPVPHNDINYAPDTEGVEHQYNLTKKERNPELRRRCIAYYKSLWGGRIHCICCGFDFEKAYGDIGHDYIEIHHIEPHYTFDGEHEVDPKTKLIPLCSNCHSMIHRVMGRGECMTLKELRENYKGIIYKNCLNQTGRQVLKKNEENEI